MSANDRTILRNLYLYGVCLITLLIAIFAAVGVVRNVVELVYPDPFVYIGYEDGASAAEREREERAARDSQRRDTVLSLVGWGTALGIAAPAYGYHWRAAQAERGTRRRREVPEPVPAPAP